MILPQARTVILFAALIFCTSPLFAQGAAGRQGRDSSGAFRRPASAPGARQENPSYANAWGLDLMFSTNGFGLGAFYRHEYTSSLAGFVDFSVSEARDDDEVEFYDPNTGQTFVPGKINRFLVMPLFFGLQKRMFEDDIMDNFRPYVDAGIGPTMIYVFPYNEEYFSALGRGHPTYTVGSYAGIGAYFGSERSSLFGLSVRYYFVPYPGGIESFARGNQRTTKNQFGGLYISLNWGGSW